MPEVAPIAIMLIATQDNIPSIAIPEVMAHMCVLICKPIPTTQEMITGQPEATLIHTQGNQALALVTADNQTHIWIYKQVTITHV